MHRGYLLLLMLLFLHHVAIAAPGGLGTEVVNTEAPTTAARVWIFAATLGQNWAGFPVVEHHGLTDHPLQYTGEVWLTGAAKTDELGGQWVDYATPTKLADEWWLVNRRNIMLGWELIGELGQGCCWYSGCPMDNPPLPVDYDPDQYYQGCNPAGCCPNGYCPGRSLWENSRFPMDVQGNITLTDYHGGAASWQAGELRGLNYIGSPGMEILTEIRILFVYVRPAIWEDAGNVGPGQTVRLNYRYEGIWSTTLFAHPQALAVHHTTSDASWATRGRVDASDLAAIAAGLGRSPCYGLSWEDWYGGTCHWWWADANADWHIDAGDIAMWSADAGHNCALSKVEAARETERILAWFGMAYTDEMVSMPWGEAIRKVVILDEAQMQRAIRDPYGYLLQARTAGVPRSWSFVTRLYR